MSSVQRDKHENQVEPEIQLPPELEVRPEGSPGSLSDSGSLSSSWVLLPDDVEEQQGAGAASGLQAPCTIDGADETTSDACVSDAPDGDLSTSMILDAMADECQSTGSDVVEQVEEGSTAALEAGPPSPLPEPPLKPSPVALEASPAPADAKVCKEDVGRLEALLNEPSSAINADCDSDKVARRHVWERRVLLAMLLISTHAAALCIGIAIGSRKGGSSESSSSMLTRRYSSGPYNSSTPWLSLASSSRLCRS